MNISQPFDDNPRFYGLSLIAIGIGALASAYTAQYVFDMEPCILCLYQRVPYAAIIVLGIAGAAKPGWLEYVLGLAALTFLIGGSIAFYHVGVEQHWWASAAGCAGGLAQVQSPQNLLQGLNAPPPKACDAVDWALFGVSMAGWNTLTSFVLTGFSVRAWGRLKREDEA